MWSTKFFVIFIIPADFKDKMGTANPILGDIMPQDPFFLITQQIKYFFTELKPLRSTNGQTE